MKRSEALKTVVRILFLYLGFWIVYGALFGSLVGSGVSLSSVLVDEIGSALLVFFLLRDARRTHLMTSSELGIVFESAELNVLFGLLVGVSLWLVVGIISEMIKQVLPNWAMVPPHHSHVIFYNNSKGMSKAILFFIFALSTPVIEEVLFRGLVYSTLRRAFSVTAALVLSSSLFGLMHVYLELGILTFLIGSGLTLLRVRRKTLLGSIIAHATINCLTLAFS